MRKFSCLVYPVTLFTGCFQLEIWKREFLSCIFFLENGNWEYSLQILLEKRDTGIPVEYGKILGNGNFPENFLPQKHCHRNKSEQKTLQMENCRHIGNDCTDFVAIQSFMERRKNISPPPLFPPYITASLSLLTLSSKDE